MLAQLYLHWKGSYSGIPERIWFLALVNLINRCGGMVVSFISLYLIQRLGYSITDAGYIMVFFGIGALTGAYAGGKLTDLFGYYWVQFWSLIFNGIFLIALLLVHDFYWMCLAIFTMSVCSEVFRPANSVSIVRNSSEETRTRSISLYRMSANIGWAIAPAVGGLLVAFGWHWLFWVDGVSCILAALMLRLYMNPPSREEAGAPSKQKADLEALPKDERSPLSDTHFLWFVLITMVGAIVFMQMLWTVPVFFKEAYHWTERQIGLMVGLNGLLVFLIEMPLIFKIDGKRPGMSYVRFGLLLYLLAYLCFLSPLAAVWAAMLYMLFISLGEIFVMPFSSNYVMGRAPKGKQGIYMSYYMMAYSLANIIAPLLGTQVIEHFGFKTLWSAVIILAAVALLGLWLLNNYTANREDN